MKKIIKLTKSQFEVFASNSRHPDADKIGKELEWYSNKEKTIFGILIKSLIEPGYVGVLVKKNSDATFDFMGMCENNNIDETRIKLLSDMQNKDKSQNSPQKNTKGIDVFTPIVTKTMNPGFVYLNETPFFFPAKSIIKELISEFTDVDNNFVEQFQTTGFDSRIWELYLHCYLKEEYFILERDHNAPDFVINKNKQRIALEACTIGRNAIKHPNKKILELSPEEMLEANRNLIPIRFGSTLYSKLNKEKPYWELLHTKGIPLIFAIADFHDEYSMCVSSTGLAIYLYGYAYTDSFVNGQQIIIPEKIKEHRFENKVIPSGFFFQPKSEHVSAVLTSSCGTISKFNRMGRQCGYKKNNYKILHTGTKYNPRPNASMADFFSYEVNETSRETWADGLSLYHNPNALYPISETLFPNIVHHYLENTYIRSVIPPSNIMSSMTLNLGPES